MFKLIMRRKRRCRYAHVKRHKRKKENNVEEDKISKLPDDVLVFILSFMTMKEAARTSVLSRRWRKVWAFIPSLNFDAPNKLDQEVSLYANPRGLKLVHAARLRHINWINRVLESYQGSTIDKFRVQFDLDENNKHDLDRWVNFASEKKVKELVMDLNKVGGISQDHKYTFPLFCNSVRRLPDFSSLRTLLLKGVNVSGDGIDYLLSSCMYLGQLYVLGSMSLVDLKVDGQSLSLKHLKIKYCRNLESIYISATNLLSFKYSGRPQVSFGNVPNLVELRCGDKYGEYITWNFLQLRNIAFQLETLTLNVYHVQETSVVYFPVLTHLKKLRLFVVSDDDERLLALASSLIEASPSLHKFVLVVLSNHCLPYSRARGSVEKAPKCPHQCLKVVELVGFVGRTMEIEMITYFIENAVMLEEIIVDPVVKYMLLPFKRKPMIDLYAERLKAAGERAVQLKSEFPKLVLRNILYS
ncbi:F-box/FBD/LRR-repeat protein [Tripterygium wilfordii]|uniref:F-box/FBD/LRR-repeat protein n=2 Tax=Tripterygium wilfordii TaxID=458696 RepID=A0A7J7D583_TRIWF|nr:F-box/LRR-repeat protein At2g42730-like isoform X1 [Tripterygium wilfordii]KAF5741517.1 F-box/FBD/LRR-repeat protein [Tripterygium wilfordii]